MEAPLFPDAAGLAADDIYRLASEGCPPAWREVFARARNELRKVASVVARKEREGGYASFPDRRKLFAAFELTPLASVKVVLFGQDPYHQRLHNNKSRACGLAFSVRRSDAVPGSLLNIYKELASTVPGFAAPPHGKLKGWARQGVLLLNTCLTVKPGCPNDHGGIWKGFLQHVLEALAETRPHCVYLLWGREAQKLKPMLGDKGLVLEAAHPSGLSAARGFFGCNHFALANEYLKKVGERPIDWGALA